MGGKKQLKCTINFLALSDYQGRVVYGLSGYDGAKAIPNTSLCVAYDPAGAEGQVRHPTVFQSASGRNGAVGKLHHFQFLFSIPFP